MTCTDLRDCSFNVDKFGRDDKVKKLVSEIQSKNEDEVARQALRALANTISYALSMGFVSEIFDPSTTRFLSRLKLDINDKSKRALLKLLSPSI